MRRSRGEIRKSVIGTELELDAIQANSLGLQVIRRQRVSFAGHGDGEHARSGSVVVDGEQRNAAGRAAQTVGIEVETALDGNARLEHLGIHQFSPQQRAPVVRLRRQRDVIEEAVVARNQRVVGDDRDALPGEAAELVEIAERVEERAS